MHVEKSDAGLGLAEFCAKRGGISLEDARAGIDRGGAYVYEKRIRDHARAMKAGEIVTLHLTERGETPHADALGLERILYIDDHLLAIDKPAGVLAQEGLAGGPDLSALASALLASRPKAAAQNESTGSAADARKENPPDARKANPADMRRGSPAARAAADANCQALLVHRLDRGTTGVTLLARTPEAQAALLESFRAGEVDKEYLALCEGMPEDDQFVVDLALGPDENLTGRRTLDPDGQPARTRFKVKQRWPDVGPRGISLIAAFPETGRTHQIRVHLSARSLPLLGDARYDGAKFISRKDGRRIDLPRPMLHARALVVPHPVPRFAKQMLRVTAPEPADFRAAIEFLESSEKA